ncbi:MAG TPA: sugar transferase [Allosphingosinicella sp.]|jgi:lipopolysaccharide/colanic/teichoic acid biosynthesis glycosyltransferase
MARVDPKRLTDILLSAAGLVVLAPVLVAVAAAVAVALGRPVFFRQVRPGLHGRPFRLIKFRTMLDSVDSDGNPLDDAQRLTRFGRFLRSSSLDELPELWNVLTGDMSLVGPRPLLMRYLPLYSPDQARRHDVRPGLTGWSQVNGRNALGWPEKLALDTWYVDHRSFALDLKILLMTVAKVLSRSGIAAEGSETMPEFRGDEVPSKSSPAFAGKGDHAKHGGGALTESEKPLHRAPRGPPPPESRGRN